MRLTFSVSNRVRLSWLWLRHSYWFRWAHKPLCDRFHRETIAVGRVRLCRSCSLLYLGMVLGVVVAFVVAHMAIAAWPILLGLASVTVLLSMPSVYKYWPRTMRDVLRFAAGLLPALCGLVAWQGQVAMALVTGLSIIAFWLIYLRIRSGRRSHMCDGCPELGADGICSGYVKQASSIREYETAASRLVMMTVHPGVAKRST